MYNNFIQNTLVVASKIASENFGKVSSTVKSEDNNQVLTEADIEIGKFITSEIRKQYPDYNILDEELGVIDNKSDFTWVVDPIDGTSNLAMDYSDPLTKAKDNFTFCAGGPALHKTLQEIVSK